MRTPGKNPGAGGVGRLGRASRRLATGEGAGHRRGIREEQQESRVAPISEHKGQAGSAPRAECTAGPGLAKPLFPAALALPACHGRHRPQKPPGPCTQRWARSPQACPWWEPGSEGPS